MSLILRRLVYHHKSADWAANRPFRLDAWSAAELAKLPTYYIMARDRGMAETVAAEMPSAAEIAACQWLPDDALAVYSAEYRRTGFQGGLRSYRCGTDPRFDAELAAFAGRAIEVPSCFIAGASDWGVYQSPGALETMQSEACTEFRAVTWFPAPATGSSRSSPGRWPRCCSNSWPNSPTNTARPAWPR